VRNSHIYGELILNNGLEKTGEDVFDQGRRAVIYYECDEGSKEYVARYFQSARRWLGHQLGEELRLGYVLFSNNTALVWIDCTMIRTTAPHRSDSRFPIQ
jgi:hypothetical protein